MHVTFHVSILGHRNAREMRMRGTVEWAHNGGVCVLPLMLMDFMVRHTHPLYWQLSPCCQEASCCSPIDSSSVYLKFMGSSTSPEKGERSCSSSPRRDIHPYKGRYRLWLILWFSLTRTGRKARRWYQISDDCTGSWQEAAPRCRLERKGTAVTGFSNVQI